MASPIAELLVNVGADVSGAINGFNTVDDKVKTFAQTSQAALPASAALAGIGVGIAAGFGEAIGTAADFEKQMSGIKAVLSPADVALFSGSLHDLALTLGKETSFSASEAAAGIEELVKAGIPVEAILGGAAKSALALAAATGIPVADAATVASQAMNAFKVDASDLTGVVDTLAGVANATAADMSGLKFGLSAVGNVASTVGFSFDDTAKALGIFADRGLVGSDAGTSLKTMLLNLQPGTAKQAKLFHQLGLITEDGANQFFDATGKVKGMADVAQVLQKALEGQTQQQKLATLETLFGSDAIRAAAILADTGAAGFEKLGASMEGITAATSSAERLNNLQGSTEQLKGSLEVLSITIGERLTPLIRPLVDGATGLVNAFLGLPQPVQTAVLAFVAVVGIVAALVGGIGLAAAAVSILGPAFVALGGVLAAVGAAFLPIVAVGAAVAGIGYLIYTNWGLIQPVLDQFTSALGSLVQYFITTLTEGDSLNDFLADLPPGIQPVVEAFGNLALFLKDTVIPAMGAVVGFIGTNVVPVLMALGNFVLAGLQAEVRSLAKVWTDVLLPALGVTGDFFAANVLPPFQALADLLHLQLLPFISSLLPILGPLLSAMGSSGLFEGGNASGAASGLQGATSAINAAAEATRAGGQASVVTDTSVIVQVNNARADEIARQAAAEASAEVYQQTLDALTTGVQRGQAAEPAGQPGAD